MSPFLNGVPTEEDFTNALLTEINAITTTAKIQSPKRKRGLEDDGNIPATSSPNHRPNKKAKNMVRSTDGQLEWLDTADAQWKPAGYHRDFREQLLALSARQPGADPWSPALGTDWTSFSPLIQGWTENPDTVRDSKGRRVFEMERPPRGWVKRPPYGHLTYNGLIMLDHENEPLRDIPGLPLTLASEHQGWLLEGLRRCTRIKVNDFIARYPYKVGYSALLAVMSRWRESKGIRTWAPKKRQSNDIKKPESAVATSDGEGSAILASPIIPHTQSGSPTVASSGQEWPPSPEALSQSPYAAYSETGSCNFAVGYSTPSPWDAGSSVKIGVQSSHPMLQQIQPGNPNNGFLTTEYSPWDAESSNRRREGHYPNVPETSYYDQKNTESIVRRVIKEQWKQAGSRANIPIAMPQSASFQPLCSIRSEPQDSLFSHGDFYSAQPTNIVESNFVQSLLEYSRSHYRTLMSREPPITTFGATYAYQYSELQTHLEQLWPYLGLPPELRAVAPVSGRYF